MAAQHRPPRRSLLPCAPLPARRPVLEGDGRPTGTRNAFGKFFPGGWRRLEERKRLAVGGWRSWRHSRRSRPMRHGRQKVIPPPPLQGGGRLQAQACPYAIQCGGCIAFAFASSICIHAHRGRGWLVSGSDPDTVAQGRKGRGRRGAHAPSFQPFSAHGGLGNHLLLSVQSQTTVWRFRTLFAGVGVVANCPFPEVVGGGWWEERGNRGGRPVRIPDVPPPPQDPPKFSNPSFSKLRFWRKVLAPKAPKIFFGLIRGYGGTLARRASFVTRALPVDCCR